MAFAESFLGGGTDFEEPLTKGIELIENYSFRNADIVFLTDGECAISDDFANTFRNKSKELNFTVTGILMDACSPGMSFSLTPFCTTIYRLSEISNDDIAGNIIRKLG